MSFPADPLGSRTELFYDGVWNDITSDVQQRADIEITVGKTGQSSQTAPTHMSLTLNNAGGKYSPRNPTSVLWEKIGRNTPIRMGLGGVCLVLDDGADDARTPDSAALSITGDIDVRIDLALTGVYTWSNSFCLLGKDDSASTISWHFEVASGQLRLQWSTDGTAEITALSTVALPDVGTQERKAVRATLDVDNGASGNTTTFYYADTIAGPWTQLGAPVVNSGVTSIFDSTSSVYVGESAAVEFFAPDGEVFAAEIRNGIGGTVVAAPDFTAATYHAATYTDPQGNVWTPSSGAEYATKTTGGNLRCTLAVVEWPPKWDTSGNDAYVPIEAAGILRRVNNSDEPVFSSLKGYYLTTNPITYWPLDDGTESLKGVPAKGTYQGSTFHRRSNKGVITFGDGILGTHLAPSLRINDLFPAAGADVLEGYCIGSSYAPLLLAWEFVYRADPTISGDGTEMSTWSFAVLVASSFLGGFDRWELHFRVGGGNDDVQLARTEDYFDTFTTTVLGDSAALDALIDGQLHHVRLELIKDSPNIDYAVYVDGVSVLTGTVGGILQRASRVWVSYDRLGAAEDLLALGHVIAWENSSAPEIGTNVPLLSTTSNLAFGFSGEAAGRRFERLADEADVAFVSIGDLDDTVPMGLQFQDYFHNQLTEIEATDMGLIYEPPFALALGYRTRTSLYAQAPAVIVDYSAHELTPPFEPVDDDSHISNDRFVQRREGGSYQVTLEDGPLSVQDPPNGVGRYKGEAQVNTERDGQLQGIAFWLLALGTVDEARYPKLIIDRANPAVAANATLVAGLLAMRVGDQVRIDNADNANIYDDPKLLVIGYREVINWKTHRFELVGVPGSPYDVAEYGTGVADGTDRYDTAGSELATGIDTDDTTLSVAAVAGVDGATTLWTTAATEEFGINCGGERMTVNAVTGGRPSFVGVGTSATGNNASVTPGLPAGAASGDLVLILASIRNSGTGTVNLPSNWTDLAGTGTNFRLFGRVYDGIWTMPSVTFTGGVANADTIAQSCAFRNVTMTGVLSASALNGSAQDIAVADVNTNPSERLGVELVQGWKQDDWTSVAQLTGYREIGEQVATAGDDAAQVWAYRITTVTTNTGEDFTVTGGAAAISRTNVTFLNAPQTFTVTRSENGVVKSHSAGTDVRLWKTPRYGLGN